MASPKGGNVNINSIPDDVAYSNLRKLERQLPREQFDLLKERVLKPYRARNFALGLTLMGMCAAVYGYSMYKTKIADFDDIAPPKPKSS
ncbi:hypothetical protein HDU97_004232 [Phlyctochytrium planicorne]|nr:hypothetical protein HDU97_004232 [Phlyctochytrium planicorne]